MEKDLLSANYKPVFLKIMCVLGFIYTGLTIIWNFLVWLAFTLIYRNTEGLYKTLFSTTNSNNLNMHYNNFKDEIFMFFQSLNKYIDVVSLINTAVGVIALWGIISMWKLKKYGFYIFSASLFVLLVVPLFFYRINFITIINLIFNSIMSIIFIVLFMFNLKHLKN